MKMVLVLAPVLRKLFAERSIPMRRSQFELLPTPPDRIVFLGDSITEQGNWPEWFPRLQVLNRGIGFDTVGGVLARLDSAINEPRAISLLVGTNDLGGLGRSRHVGDIATEFDGLLARLRALAPNAVIVVNGVMPRWAWMAEDIQRLNSRYRDSARVHGATYLDLWPAFAGPDGGMRGELSGDGTHLNGAGYRAWTDLLCPHLAASTVSADSDASQDVEHPE